MEDARPKAYATRFFHARIHNRDLLQAKDKRKSYDYEQQLLYKIKAAGRASVDKSHMRMAKEREGEAKRGEAELQVRAPIDLRALPGAKLVDGGERSVFDASFISDLTMMFMRQIWRTIEAVHLHGGFVYL